MNFRDGNIDLLLHPPLFTFEAESVVWKHDGHDPVREVFGRIYGFSGIGGHHIVHSRA
jgi:hypothetical protein